MRIQLFHEIVHGLKEIHDRGICHYDIKVQNILVFNDPSIVDDSTKIRITDFGIASPADEHRDYFVGTLSNMAPEQAREHLRGFNASFASLDCKKVSTRSL